jgi:hypothetical protein
MEGVKYARDDLIDKLDECETTLRGARNRIGELDDELAATQVMSSTNSFYWSDSLSYHSLHVLFFRFICTDFVFVLLYDFMYVLDYVVISAQH